MQLSPPLEALPQLPSLKGVMSAVDDGSHIDDAWNRLIMSGDCVLDAAAGIHLASKNRELFAKPLIQRCMDMPVIIIGSGQSLDESIPRLKELTQCCYMIAAHSALSKLNSHGIEPHAWAPVERIPVYTGAGNLINGDHHCLAYAGLPVVPDAHRHCGWHWLVTNVDPLYHWLGCPSPDIFACSGTGVHAAFVGSVLTSAPVYLVGNDIASGHFKGYEWSDTEPESESVLCVDGVERVTKPIYMRMRRELSYLSQRHTLVQTGRTVARIPGAQHGELPYPQRPTEMSLPTGSTARYDYAVQRFTGLRDLCDTAAQRARAARSMRDLDATALGGDQGMLFMALFNSLYTSMSCLRRTMCLSESDAVAFTSDAMLNVLNGMSVMIDEVAHDA